MYTFELMPIVLLSSALKIANAITRAASGGPEEGLGAIKSH